MIGENLAHYQVTELLGRGGMGEVYRARDTRLGRDVALKLLPPALRDDPERLARFRREARLLAALNHPNVASLHGFEETDSQLFLVMELVEGEELAQRIREGPIPVDEVIDIARQIAAGLAAAHERGIIHRDLKPQNVKLTPEGGVKVLDFGLATSELAPDDGETLSQSPTITAALTQAGTLLGTAGYMSPEQATGRAVDARTDIFSFGVVLFEMLAGHTLFQGETTGDTLAAVIRADPEWDRLPEDLLPELRRLLRRCLAKKPRRRLHAIADAALELDDIEALSRKRSEAVEAGARSWRPQLIWLVPLAIGVGLGALFAGRVDSESGAEPKAPGPMIHSSIELAPQTRLAGWSSPTITFSPDGSALAFVARSTDGQHVYVRRLADDTAVRIPDSAGAEGPFFSPDGKHVAFGCGNISSRAIGPRRLKRYEIETGRTSTICELGDYFGGTWREDGQIFFTNVQPGGLWRVSAEGGVPVPLSEDSMSSIGWPTVLPSSNSPSTKALVVIWKVAGRIATVDLETGALTELGIDGSFARYSPTGHLLVAENDGNVWAYRFDPSTGEVGAGRAQMLENVTLTGNEAAALAISPTGTLAYTQGIVDDSRRDYARAQWFYDDGRTAPLELEAGSYRSVAISPDGTQLALSTYSRPIEIHDLERKTRLRLPRGSTNAQRTVIWSPDGRSIVFTGMNDDGLGGSNLYLQPVDGVQLPRRLEKRPGEFFPRAWVPGTSTLLHDGYHVADGIDFQIYSLDLSDPANPTTVLNEEGNEWNCALSPDGRWLIYNVSESERTVMVARPFPDLSTRIPLGEGTRPTWSADGSTLYSWLRVGEEEAALQSRAVRVVGNRLEAEPVKTLHRIERFSISAYDPAGDRHLVFQEVPGTGEIHSIQLVQNFASELERRLPTQH